MAHLASEAAFLVAAERARRVELVVDVRPDDAGGRIGLTFHLGDRPALRDSAVELLGYGTVRTPRRYASGTGWTCQVLPEFEAARGGLVESVQKLADSFIQAPAPVSRPPDIESPLLLIWHEVTLPDQSRRQSDDRPDLDPRMPVDNTSQGQGCSANGRMR